MRHLPHPFEIVVRDAPTAEPIFVRSAADADQATTLFHAEIQRLRAEGVKGEVAVLKRQDGGKAILRQPLCP